MNRDREIEAEVERAVDFTPLVFSL